MSQVIITPMTDAEFEEAQAKHLEPFPCLRCGRFLYSPASIVRGYGQVCAFLQALEELSHGSRNPTKPVLREIPTAQFVRVSETITVMVDHRDLEIGEIKRNAKKSAWEIHLWGKMVDLDMDYENAKKRATRILEKMGR